MALLLLAMGAGCEASSSNEVDFQPFVFPAESMAANDLMGADAVFDRTKATSFSERSEARVLVESVEIYQHSFEVSHSQSPRAFVATLSYSAGRDSRKLAIDSGSLSAAGFAELIAIDGTLYQNVGEGWDAQGYVGISFALGASPTVRATQAFGSLGTDGFSLSENTELAGMAVSRYTSNNPEVLTRIWASVAETSGSMAPALEVDSITDGVVTVVRGRRRFGGGLQLHDSGVAGWSGRPVRWFRRQLWLQRTRRHRAPSLGGLGVVAEDHASGVHCGVACVGG